MSAPSPMSGVAERLDACGRRVAAGVAGFPRPSTAAEAMLAPGVVIARSTNSEANSDEEQARTRRETASTGVTAMRLKRRECTAGMTTREVSRGVEASRIWKVWWFGPSPGGEMGAARSGGCEVGLRVRLLA